MEPHLGGSVIHRTRVRAAILGLACLAFFSLGIAVGSQSTFSWKVNAFTTSIVSQDASYQCTGLRGSSGCAPRLRCARWREGQTASCSSDCSRIRHIAVLGERNSGTNTIESLLRLNLDLSSGIYISPNLTAHKHFMQPASPEPLCDTLVLLGVRNVYDWSYRMWKVCYCCFASGLLSSPDIYHEFLQKRYVPVTRPFPVDLCHQDVDIERHKLFANMTAMRTTKYAHWLNLTATLGVRALEVVRWEGMLDPRQQVAWVQEIAAKYKLPLNPRLAEPQALDRDARSWMKKTAFSKPNGTGFGEAKALSFYLNPARMRNQTAEEVSSPKGSNCGSGLEADCGSKVSGEDALLRQTMTRLGIKPAPQFILLGFHLLNNASDWDLEKRLGYKKLELPSMRINV